MVFLSGYSFGSLPSVARNASPDKEKEHYLLSITVQRYEKNGTYANSTVIFNKL